MNCEIYGRNQKKNRIIIVNSIFQICIYIYIYSEIDKRKNINRTTFYKNVNKIINQSDEICT